MTRTELHITFWTSSEERDESIQESEEIGADEAKKSWLSGDFRLRAKIITCGSKVQVTLKMVARGGLEPPTYGL